MTKQATPRPLQSKNMTTHSRAEAMRGAFCSSGPRQSTFGYSQQQNHRRDRSYSYGSRIPKTTPRHQTSSNTLPKEPISLPTHSSSRNVEDAPLPSNSRLDFLKKEKKPLRWSDEVPLASRKKKTFVAMPSKAQWEKGFRPAWMLSEHQDPPEKYEDGFWMYQNYLKTGEVDLRKRKSTVDKTKATATNYMNNYTSTKKNRK